MQNETAPIKTNELITPDMARQYLERNSNIRPINRRHVAFLAKMMSAGTWNQLIGTPITFDREGRLRNGQHRLHAIIQSKSPVAIAVWRDTAESIIELMDYGQKNRETHLNVTLVEGRDKNRIAVRLCKLLGRPVTERKELTALTNDEIRQVFLEWSDEIEFLVPLAQKYEKSGIARVFVMVAFCEYLKRNRPKAVEFVEAFFGSEKFVQQAAKLKDYLLMNIGRAGSSFQRQDYGRTVFVCLRHEASLEVKVLNQNATWNESPAEINKPDARKAA